MGVQELLEGTVIMGREMFDMLRIEFENQKRNFETQNQVWFMMRKFQKFSDQTLGTYSSIKIWLIDFCCLH